MILLLLGELVIVVEIGVVELLHLEMLLGRIVRLDLVRLVSRRELAGSKGLDQIGPTRLQRILHKHLYILIGLEFLLTSRALQQ